MLTYAICIFMLLSIYLTQIHEIQVSFPGLLDETCFFGHIAEVMIVMLRGSVPHHRCPESGFRTAWCDMRYALLVPWGLADERFPFNTKKVPFSYTIHSLTVQYLFPRVKGTLTMADNFVSFPKPSVLPHFQNGCWYI